MLFKNEKKNVYALTHADVQKIWALLSAARDAISELLDYRKIEEIDERTDFQCENSLFDLSSRVLRDCEQEDTLF